MPRCLCRGSFSYVRSPSSSRSRRTKYHFFVLENIHASSLDSPRSSSNVRPRHIQPPNCRPRVAHWHVPAYHRRARPPVLVFLLLRPQLVSFPRFTGVPRLGRRQCRCRTWTGGPSMARTASSSGPSPGFHRSASSSTVRFSTGSQPSTRTLIHPPPPPNPPDQNNHPIISLTFAVIR